MVFGIYLEGFVGVLEYWSTGVLGFAVLKIGVLESDLANKPFHYSTIPLLQHSNNPPTTQ
jgi:hypothetical protein